MIIVDKLVEKMEVAGMAAAGPCFIRSSCCSTFIIADVGGGGKVVVSAELQIGNMRVMVNMGTDRGESTKC